MEDLHMQLLIDLHKQNHRQGPGGEEETRQALKLASLDPSRPLKIADIGCGTGASTLILAKELDAHITAVDFLPEFLEELQIRARSRGVAEKITTLECSMDALPFADEEFDLIWSEGAIYNMGFQAGIAAWRRLLKPEGKLVVSEITWLTVARPREIESHWQREYPEIDLASAKMRILEEHGYTPEGYFILPSHCWLEHYYRPMQSCFEAFLERHSGTPQARDVVGAEEREMALYEKYNPYYSYGVYVGKKCPW